MSNFSTAATNPVDLFGIGVSAALAISSLIIFLIPQMGIHVLLSQMKNQVVGALVLRRDETNTKFLLQFTDFSTGLEGSREMPPFGLKALVEHLERIIETVIEQPTWSYRMPTALKLVGTSCVPFLVAILNYVLQLLQIPITP